MPTLTVDELNTYFSSKERSPQMLWKWKLLEFPNLGSGITSPPDFYCEKINLPFSQISEKTKNIAATNIFLAGLSQIQSFDIEIYEDEQLSSLLYLTEWQNSIQNPQTGGYFPANNYKKDMTVHLYNSQNVATFKILLRNCFPLGLQNISLAYDTNDRMRHNINFACDASIPSPL
jgi:hypothetical protein